MAFPAVVTTNESATPTASTSHVVNLPASLVSGNLILILLDKGTPASTASFNTLAGWIELLDEAVASGMAVWYRVSNGAEGASVTFTSTVAIRDATISYQILGAEDPAVQAPQLSTVATGTSANPNATTCTPTGGAKDYLWITFFGQTGEQLDDDTLTTVTPTGFTNPLRKTCGTAGTNLGGMIASAQQQLNAASLDAAAWTSSDATAWRAFTIAIHPAPPVLKQGSASGSLAWVGSANGIQDTSPNEGQPIGAIDWVGTATGISVHSGSAVGAIAWAGTATGAPPRIGSVSGAITWVGSANGDVVYRWVEFPGTVSNYLWTADTAALDIVGDLCIVARVALDGWTPATTPNTIVGKWETTGNQKSYILRVNATTGFLALLWSPDGTASPSANSTVAPTVGNGAWLWVAVTLDVDNGSAQKSVRFWTSNDGTTWDQLGTTVTTATVTSIHPGTSRLEIGARDATSGSSVEPLAGNVAYVSIRDGIGASGTVGGTEVFRLDTEVDLATVSQGATSFTATTGQTITVNRSGSPATTLVTFNPNSGTATGTVTWAGTSTGGRVSKGADVGAVTWAGTATGTSVHLGTATGVITWAGTSTGIRTPKGAPTGSVTWAGVSTGSHVSNGAVTGAVTWVGTATGEAPVPGLQEGSAFGDIARVGTVTGGSVHVGATTGTVGWAGTVTGEAPIIDVQAGSATGTITWLGTVTGLTVRRGAVAGSILWAGTAGLPPVVVTPSVFRTWRVLADDRTLAPAHDRIFRLPADTRPTVTGVALLPLLLEDESSWLVESESHYFVL